MESGYKLKMFKRKVKSFLKKALRIIYFSSTALVPIVVFAFVFVKKSNIIYAMAVAFIAFIGMDIICSILEDCTNQISKYVLHVKEKKQIAIEKTQKEKEKEFRKLEKILQEKYDYKSEICKVEESNKKFKLEIEKAINDLPESIGIYLINICEKMENVVEILKQDAEEYYPIRHTFTIYFPEFQKITYQYIDIARTTNLDAQSTCEFEQLITELSKYLDFVRSKINNKDKLSLNVGIKSLIQIMETERKKR